MYKRKKINSRLEFTLDSSTWVLWPTFGFDFDSDIFGFYGLCIAIEFRYGGK